MSTSIKKEWQPKATLSEALSVSIDWLERSRNKNCLAKTSALLFNVYALPENVPIGLSVEMSKLFRFGAKDTPETDIMRDQSLRLLGAALKVHTLLAPGDHSKHEPYISSIPDPSSSDGISLVLCHRIDGASTFKSIVVGISDIAPNFPLSMGAIRFPVILSGNSYKWFERRKWESQRQAIPSQEPKKIEVDSHVELSSFPFGSILEVPYELREFAKLSGAKWAAGVQKWYLPNGSDFEGFQEWFQKVQDDYASGGNEKVERVYCHELSGRKIDPPREAKHKR